VTTVTRGDDQPGTGTVTATGVTEATGSAVVCAGLTYRFGDHVAVDNVDLEIRHGETFGLLGPNGAGKTTTIRMLTTLLKPASGRVTVFGVDAASRPMLVRRMIGYVPQLLSADGMLTGRENAWGEGILPDAGGPRGSGGKGFPPGAGGSRGSPPRE
jgi:ABC-type molybdenum transport system ATPase subunit/photorepair protein PhrA